MKNYFILMGIILLLFGCEKHPVPQPCWDYVITIQDLERDISIMYEKEGQLKEELEQAREYIELLEEENAFYKTTIYKQ